MPTGRALRKLCLARDLIRDALDHPWALAALGSAVELSPAHLLRAFRAAFGETPHAYLTRLRLDRARELLALTARPVTEVCLDVGFTSLGTFSTLFRRRVGVSPAEYRRQARAWASVPARRAAAFVPFCFARRFGPG